MVSYGDVMFSQGECGCRGECEYRVHALLDIDLLQSSQSLQFTLPETKSSPLKNGWLEEFIRLPFWVSVTFQGLFPVSFRE